MTDEQIWERASIGERVELLRRRLDDMASTVDHTATIAEHYRGEREADARVERWKRIEEAAARTLVHIDMSPDTLAVGPAVRDLRAALDSEPKR